MKQKLIKFYNLIKKNRRTKALTIIAVLILTIFTIGYSLAMFSKNSNKNPVANIVVNGLSFNITTNSGTSNDRILHLQANKKERFHVILTNLNNLNTDYELIYDLCNDSSCTSTSTEVPSTLTVGKEEYSTEINGTINSKNKKEIVLITENTSSNDYYIKLNINAGYEWNDLELSNQINKVVDGNANTTNIIVYVDGTELQKFPDSCAYDATIKSYVENEEITNSNSTIKCDFNTKKWTTNLEGYTDKVVINFTSTTVLPNTFAEDSWETINKVITSGKGYAYPVGSEKEIEINGTSYTVRVVNNTTPSECNGDNFSQTACGFVVEFVDIWTTNQKMYSSNSNKGGWTATVVRDYLNGTFYDSLPEDLKNVIIDTKVISGHGTTSGEENFETNDMIYLPSAKEIMVDSSKSTISTQDSAWNNTRQLDYYRNIGLRASYDYLIKNKGTTAKDWWLRTARATTNSTYLSISTAGAWTASNASTSIGIAPMFRIGAKTFSEDSWSEIANNVKAGNGNLYKIGSEKDVVLSNGTSYTVRVANNTTPEECSGTDFSQTACGFVVEFVDIVEERAMNSTGTNVGGWPASEMYTYLNGDFFNKLPEDLRNVIIDTKVITGHGSTGGEANFTSTDKLYLLSAHEVLEDGTSNQISGRDTAYNNTRQLDYYNRKGVTTNNYSGAIKLYNSENYYWWLRAAYSSSSSYFLYVSSSGNWSSNSASTLGVSPAFRIG